MPELRDFTNGLPDIERALVLAPHPDDESLGLGGTIALYSGRAHFTVVAVSNGEAVNIPEDGRGELRKKELEAAVKTLGAHELIYLDIPDGKFPEHGDSIRSKLSALFSNQRPEIVFVPAPVDPHPDHRETALACMEVSRGFPFIKLAFYEVYNPVRFNVLVDIGPVIETKKRALMHYHFSMLKKEDIFIASNLGLNKSRSLFTLRDSYYEAFWIPGTVTDLSGIVSWFTCDISPPSPEDRLLSSLRAADSLLHEFEAAEGELKEKTEIIQSLSLKLDEKERMIMYLEKRLRLIDTSLSWKLIERFRKIKNGLLPEGTQRKGLYEKVIKTCKKHMP